MNKQEKHKTLLVITAGMLVLYLLIDSVYFLYVALFVSIGSLVIPALGRGIVKGWYGLAMVLGRVNSTVLLTLIYAILLVPIALLSRIRFKDKLKLKNTGSSTFEQLHKRYTPEDLENPW